MIWTSGLLAASIVWFLAASTGSGLEMFLAVCLGISTLFFGYIFTLNWTAWRIATRWSPLELRIKNNVFHGFPVHRCDILDARKPISFDLSSADITIVPAANEAIKIKQGTRMTRISAADNFVSGTYQDFKSTLLRISTSLKEAKHV